MSSCLPMILAVGLCVATLAVVHHGQTQQRDEVAQLRQTVGQLAARPPEARAVTASWSAGSAPTDHRVRPDVVAPAPPSVEPVAPAAVAALATEPPTAEQAAAIDRAHEVLADGIGAGRLTAADADELRQLYAAASGRVELGDVVQQLIVALNRGQLQLDVDMRSILP